EAAFTQLLEAGVGLWTFQPSMLHAKIMTVDGILANIGSANLNARSTALDEEINLVAIDRAIAGLLDEHFDSDLERSERLDLSRWKQRSVPQRAAEAVVTPIKRFF
ncbi:MAG TPA: phospholipase D-like domain-containing protein, partial [Acidimicrobiia bacterium]|nr:phospholipase D-like domain-containing protein [Acidimicrobiia bacterium]